MWYSEYEICYEVTHALNPYDQINILAELNEVSRFEIEKVLQKNGVELPGFQRRSGFYGMRSSPDAERSESYKRELERKREYYRLHREECIRKATERNRRRKETQNGKKQ